MGGSVCSAAVIMAESQLHLVAVGGLFGVHGFVRWWW